MDTSPRRWRLVRLHLGLAAAVLICCSGFIVEVFRALGGNTLSWAYVFEWPILLVYGVYMWRRLVLDELDRPRAALAAPPAPTAPRRVDERALRKAAQEAEDLDEWNAYLLKLHRAERGGSPGPAR